MNIVPVSNQIQPIAQQSQAGASQIALQEKLAEIQIRYISARQFPRDIVAVENGIRLACERYGVASVAEYALPVGGSSVRGASIRLAEVLAQAYGNVDLSKEVIAQSSDQSGPYSDIRVAAVDLESGTRFSEVIRIYHYRVKKQGGTVTKQPITDQSELERLFSAMAAKRLRECIFRIIPRDLTEKALDICRETVKKGDGSKPLFERVKGMVLEFERIGVTRQELEEKVGAKIELWTPEHFADMLAVFRSIRDGQASASEFFESKKQPENSAAEKLKEKMKGPVKAPESPAASADVTP